jgi:hypothetical protein
MAGRCVIELGSPGRAEPLLSGAVATYPEEHPREVALYLSWLAESYARTGELDAARATLERAKGFASRMPSTRTDDRFKAVENTSATSSMPTTGTSTVRNDPPQH